MDLVDRLLSSVTPLPDEVTAPRVGDDLVPHAEVVMDRAVRHLDPTYGALRVGDVIPDYGGRNETFEVAVIEPPRHLVYTSRRGRTYVSWAIVLTPDDHGTRVHRRLRLADQRKS